MDILISLIVGFSLGFVIAAIMYKERIREHQNTIKVIRIQRDNGITKTL